MKKAAAKHEKETAAYDLLGSCGLYRLTRFKGTRGEAVGCVAPQVSSVLLTNSV